MELDYTFEMQSIFPKAIWLEPLCSKLMSVAEIAHNMKGNYVSAFVDPATAVALWRESPELRSTLIKAGWSTLPFEGDLNIEKTHFIISALLEISTQADRGIFDTTKVRYAVFDLYRFTKKLTMGELLDEDGKPRCSSQFKEKMQNTRPTSAFDISKALMAMASDPRNKPA